MRRIIVSAVASASIAVAAVLGVQDQTRSGSIQIAPADKLCPVDWQDTSANDGHVVVLSCSRDGWLVILKPDRMFDYAWFDGAPDFTYSPEGIPGWPR